MNRNRTGRNWAVALGEAAFLACIWAGGCVPGTGGNPGVDGTDGNVGVDPGAYPDLKVQGEPNGSFDQPITVVLDGSNRGQLAGTISSAGDLDMYVFTTLQAGDRLIVDLSAPVGSLDADMALFDEAGRILFENDDRSLNPPLLDPYANQIIRRESRLYYLAVYRSPLAAERKIGRYEVLITLVPGGQVPPGEGQLVVLDFDGGSIVLIDSSYAVGAFDTADISPVYAGMTAAVRNRVDATRYTRPGTP